MTHYFQYLKVFDTHTHQHIGQLSDISRQGMMLLVKEPLALHQTYDIFIQLSEEEYDDVDEKSHINIQIETVWIRPDLENPNHYCVGCHFTEISMEDIAWFLRHKNKASTLATHRPIRKNLLFYLDVIDARTHKLIGHVGDISNDGMMILAEHPLFISDIKHVIIKLPDLEEFNQDSIDAMIEVRWTNKDTNPQLHCIGCHFLKLSNADNAIISEVAQLLGFDDEVL